MDGITQPQESTVFLLGSTVSSCNSFPYYILVIHYTMNRKKIK